MNQQLIALRAEMKKSGVEVYIVPGTDPHASEYMAPHWMEMQWISGFTGESGTAVVTENEALLWTDSRYYLQAEEELKGTGFGLMRESDVDCPSIVEWLQERKEKVVGVNAEMYSVNGYQKMRQELEDGGKELRSIDLIRGIWEDRPSIPMHPLYAYDECYAGEGVESKLGRIREVMRQRHCQAMIISALDEIGWAINVRGTDVDYTPCVIAYLVVEEKRCTLFIHPDKVDKEAHNYLSSKGIDRREYEEVYAYLSGLEGTVLLDGNRVNEALSEAVRGKIQNVSPSPVQVMMSIKNEVEIAGERSAMRRDAVALTRFFRWLETEAMQHEQTEITLAEKLHAFRAMGEKFTDESFCTIAGWQGNGAIVHYHAEEANCAKIVGDGVLLLDSGGQYLDGTTDITRTVWIGDETKISEQVKHDFTLVLKGHIALCQARFPKGTRGNQLDVLAHQFMWQEGITYGHGTGHGVGHFMGCHEGPANIRTDNNTNPIQLGNIFSDEPGIYRAGEYGIRTENLMVTVPAKALSARSTGEKYYEFEVLTLCFYDTRLIDMAMLTEAEKDWLNRYHQRVYEEVSGQLNKEEQEYLRNKCKAL